MITQRQVPAVLRDRWKVFRSVHQQAHDVLRRDLMFFTVFYGIFRTLPHGVESRRYSDFFGEPSKANSCWSSRVRRWRGRWELDSQVFCHMKIGVSLSLQITVGVDIHIALLARVQNNNTDTIWGGSVLIGEEPPHHSGELIHALSQVGGPTQPQLSRPMLSRHYTSVEHRLRRKHF